MWTQTRQRAVAAIEKHTNLLFSLGVLVACLLALYLRTLHLTDTPARSPDERLYTSFALRIAREGLGAYPGIFQSYASDPSQWIYPSPTRVGHVLLFAGVMKLTGAESAQAGAAVSWFLGSLSVLLLARLARRYVGAAASVLAALLLASYTVELEFARRAWGESTAVFLTVCLLWATLALDAAPGERRRWAAFFVLGTFCLLGKETCIFAYATCGLWLVARQWSSARQLRRALGLCLGGLGSIAAALALLVWLAGSLELALAGWWHVFGNGLGSNAWGALHASGAWYRFLELLWVVAPLTAALATLGVLAVVLPGWSRVFEGQGLEARACASLCLWLTLGLIAACAFGPNLQYLRIMAPANPSYCLLAALGARALAVLSRDVAEGRLQALGALLFPPLLAVAGARDYALYRDVVVRSGMQDLTGRWILEGVARRQRPELDRTRQALAPGAQQPAAPRAASQDPLQRSLEACRRGAYADCVAASQAAIAENPSSPEAWNNAAAGYSGLGRWDEAIQHASRALELRSHFPLARNNLAWAREQKARGDAAGVPRADHFASSQAPSKSTLTPAEAASHELP